MTRPLVVTVSAPYGAAGSEIGPRLADTLGVPFLDRAIPAGVAAKLAMPLRDALERDECPPAALERLLRPFATLGPALAGTTPIPPFGEESVATATEEIIRDRADRTGGVILGRAGAVVLAGHPGALHVRLTGSRERRLEQAMRVEGVDRLTAERRMKDTDRARAAYLRYFYDRDPDDPGLYHLVLDSTAIEVDACVELIARAAGALRVPAATPDG